MPFVIIAVIIGALELWAVASGGHGEPALPPLVRLGGPVLLALSALRHQGLDRAGIALSAGVVFLLVNSEVIPSATLTSILIGVGCAALAFVGASSIRRSGISLWSLAVAACASLGTYMLLLWALTR